jgi:hypothetical protein
MRRGERVYYYAGKIFFIGRENGTRREKSLTSREESVIVTPLLPAQVFSTLETKLKRLKLFI